MRAPFLSLLVSARNVFDILDILWSCLCCFVLSSRWHKRPLPPAQPPPLSTGSSASAASEWRCIHMEIYLVGNILYIIYLVGNILHHFFIHIAY